MLPNISLPYCRIYIKYTFLSNIYAFHAKSHRYVVIGWVYVFTRDIGTFPNISDFGNLSQTRNLRKSNMISNINYHNHVSNLYPKSQRFLEYGHFHRWCHIFHSLKLSCHGMKSSKKHFSIRLAKSRQSRLDLPQKNFPMSIFRFGGRDDL